MSIKVNKDEYTSRGIERENLVDIWRNSIKNYTMKKMVNNNEIPNLKNKKQPFSSEESHVKSNIFITIATSYSASGMK